MNFAVLLGQFVGAALAQCAPVLVEIAVEIIHKSRIKTIEDSNPPVDLSIRLSNILQRYKDDNHIPR